MKTEKVLACFLLAGLLLKFFHIPGGSLVVILTMMVVILLYFPFGVYFLSDEKIDKRKIGFSILSGFVLSVYYSGILFKLMNWPGGSFLILCCSIFIIPLAVISYLNFVNLEKPETTKYYKNLLLRYMIAFVFGVTVFFLV